MAKVQAAKEALREVDTEIVNVLLALDGEDTRSFEIVDALTKKLEVANMALGALEHPVQQHWGGGRPEDNVPNTLDWRY